MYFSIRSLSVSLSSPLPPPPPTSHTTGTTSHYAIEILLHFISQQVKPHLGGATVLAASSTNGEETIFCKIQNIQNIVTIGLSI